MNKKVGQGLASAIEKGEQATEATKENLGMSIPPTRHTAWCLKILPGAWIGAAKDKAAKASQVASQKANQVRDLYVR